MGIVKYNGGINWILNAINQRISNRKQAEFGIAALATFCEICTGNNTVAIVTAGPIAKQISDEHGVCLLYTSLLLPQGWFSVPAKAAIGTILWMASWWITRPVHIAVTALLPIVVNALFDLVPMAQVISQYASEIVVLLLGADLVSITWSETGLDKRLSLKALSLIGPSVKQQIVTWFVVAAGLSAFLPNVMVCAILTPIAISMLTFLGEKDPANSEIGAIILLAIAWGSGVGGCGTPLGGAMNLVAINYIEQLIGQEFMYITWVKQLMPFLVALVIVNTAYLCTIKTSVSHLKGTREFFPGPKQFWSSNLEGNALIGPGLRDQAAR